MVHDRKPGDKPFPGCHAHHPVDFVGCPQVWGCCYLNKSGLELNKPTKDRVGSDLDVPVGGVHSGDGVKAGKTQEAKRLV